MKCAFQLKGLFITLIILIIKTDVVDLTIPGFAGVSIDYIWDAVKKFPGNFLTRPSNSDDSIQYLLYTPNNTKEPCFIQPYAPAFDKCSFNPRYKTKFLIHGFVEFLSPENQFNVLKDAILEHNKYNVIIVNWTSHNSLPFRKAYRNAELVGVKVAEMMRFMVTHARVSLKTFHCIGHSLGCHVCGVVGRNARTLGRITGLDPGAISKLKHLKPNIRLKYTDADLVDVMHTSDIYALRGLGYLDPSGHLDFYFNGGVDQPGCAQGNKYKVFKGKVLTVSSIPDLVFCNHFISIEYYIESLKGDCKFVAFQCESYSDFEKGRCSSGTRAEMGFHTKKIEGIPPMTKFYLNTNEAPPYCQKQ